MLGNTVAQPNPNAANGILKNTTIAVPLKYLNNFGDYLKYLINCKVELKLKLTKYCALSAAGNENESDDDVDDGDYDDDNKKKNLNCLNRSNLLLLVGTNC